MLTWRHQLIKCTRVFWCLTWYKDTLTSRRSLECREMRQMGGWWGGGGSGEDMRLGTKCDSHATHPRTAAFSLRRCTERGFVRTLVCLCEAKLPNTWKTAHVICLLLTNQGFVRHPCTCLCFYTEKQLISSVNVFGFTLEAPAPYTTRVTGRRITTTNKSGHEWTSP